MTQQGMVIREEFSEHLDQLIAQGSLGFSMLDSYLVTATRGLNPSPPASQSQQQQTAPGTDQAAQTARAAEAVQAAIDAESAQAAQTAQAAAQAAQAAGPAVPAPGGMGTGNVFMPMTPAIIAPDEGKPKPPHPSLYSPCLC